MKKITNYIKINKQISTSGQPTKKEFKKIAKEGFDVVINLAMHNKGALKEEDKIVSKNGMLYVHIPIEWKQPQKSRMLLFLKLLKQLEDEDKRIWIHCIKNYRVSVCMHLYKKFVWKEKNLDFIKPNDYMPNETWIEILKMQVS